MNEGGSLHQFVFTNARQTPQPMSKKFEFNSGGNKLPTDRYLCNAIHGYIVAACTLYI
jgi:hypothetical protein